MREVQQMHTFPFLNVLKYHTILLALKQSNNNNNYNDPIKSVTVTKALEVCMSPGCVADGAQCTLKKLKALAPPDLMQVKSGGCVSGCGKGPIVCEIEDENKKSSIIHKRVAATDTSCEKLLTSIIEDQKECDENIPDILIKAYDFVCQADQAMKMKDYKKASQLYKEGIEMIQSLAKTHPRYALLDYEANSQDSIFKPSANHLTETTPAHLEWLVEAHRNRAVVNFEIKNLDEAYHAASESCRLSQKSDFLSLDTLSIICQARKDDIGELEALQDYFSLFHTTIDEKTLSREDANRKRTLGFRLAKLEANLKKMT